MRALVSLVVFSGLSLNLLLHFALGLRGAAKREDRPLPLFQLGIFFLAVVMLWVVFSLILNPLGLDFLEYPALFPLSVLACRGLERLFRRIFPRAAAGGSGYFRPGTAYEGLVPAALFITLGMAAAPAEALALSLGFSLGVLISLVLVKEIRLRSALEQVPPVLRGRPLALISMGLLSLIFSSVAAVLLKTLGVF
ncbi:MAG: hypothetical protein LBD09_01670 [Treponema sp.]|jgi:electron transport complex protein RnfA|nr:hypothetical protein [Treponema sp.]